MKTKAMSYTKALSWLLVTFPIDWLDTDEPAPVEAQVVAAIYDRTIKEVRADMIQERKHIFPATYGGRP